MNDKLKMFKQKHGEEVRFNLNDAKIKECLRKFSTLYERNNTYITLLAVMSLNERNVLVCPCKQCLLNTALQYEEMGSLLRELADGK